MFVALGKGEVYRVRIENRADHSVMMRLLIDGLNTLPEPKREDLDKAVRVEPTSQKKSEYLPAQRVSLDEAQAWRLKPKAHMIPGFYSVTGDNAKYREFLVVDAQESLAGRQQFTDQIGLITAAFYAVKGSSRAVGTTEGDRRDGKTGKYDANKIQAGNLLGVVHIRYVEPEVLRKVQEEEGPPTT